MKDDPQLKESVKENDDRLKYFLPPLRNDVKDTKTFPIVISDDAILTKKGVVPRNPKK